ncbi:MAG: SapC family protein [Campylobacterales bacterium]
MYANVALLNSQTDKNLKVEPLKNWSFAASTNYALITVDEFYHACKSQPILFVKDANNNYSAVAILGLKEGQNLFVGSDQQWEKGEYIPAFLRRYPFIFVQQGETLALAYDKDCKAINTKKGEALFDKEGQPTSYTDGILKFMTEYQRSALRTQAFLNELATLELLEEVTVDIRVSGENLRFSGFLRINEQKLDGLDNEKKMALVANGMYKLIVAHLISMSNFDKLAALYR